MDSNEIALLELLTIKPISYFPPQAYIMARRLARKGLVAFKDGRRFPTASPAGRQTASPFLAFGDSEAIGLLKPPARDRGLGAVGCAVAITRGNCVRSSGVSLSSLETAEST